MAKASPPPDYYDDLKACKPDLLRARLDAGSDPNAIIAQDHRAPRTPLVLVVEQLENLGFTENWKQCARLLIDAGARIVPDYPLPEPRFHPLATVIFQDSPESFDLLFDALSPADRADLPKPLGGYGAPLSLLDLALSFGNAHAAARLWEAGLEPAPSGPDAAALAAGMDSEKAIRESSLAQAVFGAHEPAMAPVIERLLALPWTQADLDNALRRAVLNPAPASLVSRLLGLGARADIPGRPDGRVSLLVHALSNDARPPEPGVIALLLRAGANASQRMDFHPARLDADNVEPHQPGSDAVARNAPLLALAARNAHAHALCELIAAGADPNAPTQGLSLSPLHLACMAGRCDDMPRVVSMLLDAGADPACLDATGRTPVEYWVSGHLTPAQSRIRPTPAEAVRLLMATLAARPDRLAPIVDALGRSLNDRNALPTDPLVVAWARALESVVAARRLGQVLPSVPRPSRPARL